MDGDDGIDRQPSRRSASEHGTARRICGQQIQGERTRFVFLTIRLTNKFAKPASMFALANVGTWSCASCYCVLPRFHGNTRSVALHFASSKRNNARFARKAEKKTLSFSMKRPIEKSESETFFFSTSKLSRESPKRIKVSFSFSTKKNAFQFAMQMAGSVGQLGNEAEQELMVPGIASALRTSASGGGPGFLPFDWLPSSLVSIVTTNHQPPQYSSSDVILGGGGGSPSSCEFCVWREPFDDSFFLCYAGHRWRN